MNALPTGSDPESTPTPESSTATPEYLTFSYVPRKGLLKLTIVNFLLGIVTLGIYRFWAKTNVRKHIWSCVHINGEPLEYTGRGIELFLGALMVFLFFILPIGLANAGATLYFGPGSPEQVAVQMITLGILYLGIFVFWGFAVYKSRHYQLTRTNWRGIRGALAGSALTYSLLYFGSIIAKTMSLGWATPVMNTVLQEQITNDMRFGDAAFKFKGRAGPLYPTYTLCWFLTGGALIFVPLLLGGLGFLLEGTELGAAWGHVFGEGQEATVSEYGIVGLFILGFIGLILLFSLIIPALWSIYIAKELRTFADYTRFDGAQFKLNATAGSIIWLSLVNVIILFFTLGIAWPYINQRLVRFVVDRLELQGMIDIDRVSQSKVKMDKRGEGLADAFDIGGL